MATANFTALSSSLWIATSSRAWSHTKANAILITQSLAGYLVHGGIMTVQALVYPEHRGHLLGDVPVLLLYAAVLAWLTPRGKKAATATR